MSEQKIKPNPNEQQAASQKHSLATQILLALGFSTVAAKLAILGTVADVGALTKGENLNLGERFKIAFNPGQLMGRVVDKIQQSMESGHGQIRASIGIFKYTFIVGAAASILGGVVGWIRGGLIADWKDIFTHPIRSTKIILGMEKPPSQEKSKEPVSPKDTFQEISPDRSENKTSNQAKYLADSHNKPTRSHVEVLATQSNSELAHSR